MATQATSSTPSSTSSSSFSFSSCPPWKYHVFLSFCGVDTRKNFTDHLYTALKQKGIITFRDDEKLERGKYISQELLKAIEESKYAIIVLSTNYTSSRWCLIELAKIVKCKKETGLTVLPVFYHVDPSDVRNQNGILAEVFAKHEKDTRISTEDVQAWKAALKDVGDISGWHLHDRHESKIIQTIIGRIFSELFHKLPCVSEDLVGMDSCVEEMLDSYIGEGLGGVRFVGICGMGGMGKTTLAHEIYRRISGNFEGRSFIVNIREETKNQGLVSLQKQLLSQILMESEINIWDVWGGINVIRNILRNKNVFIILDDVDGDEQLKALAGKHDWFGPGSRIIVTSRDSHLLIRCGVDDVYNITGLNDDEALELFSWSAFKKPHPEENFVDLSKDFVNYAKGLPLALKVLGSLLFSKRTNEWKSALYKLKKEPNRNILDILQISFDGLTNSEKGLFLDIACFFKGENKDCIGDIFGSFYNSLDYDIGVLKDKSLITIYYNGTLWMHDLLQDMGQEIVRRESPKEPGGRSRLWIYDDVIHVLKNDSGTEKVEGIMVNIPIQKVEHLSAEAFSKMKNLRLLKISSEKLSEVFINGTMQLPKDLIRGKVQLPQGLNYLSNELRLLEWHGYHLKCLPTNFQLNKLVELRMHSSSIKQLWNGNMNLGELRLIDLSDSQNLIEMPDLSGASKLKQLIFRHCTRLYKIHTSLGDLKQLIQLDLNGCKCLESLPDKINLEALEILDLGGCSRLKKFPEIVGNMSRLPKLCLSETAIKDLPLSVEHLTGLIELDLRDCKNLSSLSNACCCLMSLKILTLSGCSKLDELPENLGNIEGLENLDVSGTAITRLPLSVVHLKNLKLLSLSRCVGSSKSFNKLLNFPLMQRKRSPDPMSMLECSLQGLWSLTELDLSYCNIQMIPNVLGSLSSLRELNLKGNNFVCLPESIIQLSNLTNLYLGGCTQLQMLPKLPLNMYFIDATGCTSLETLSLSPDNGFSQNINLVNCVKLIYNQGKGDLWSAILRQNIIERCCNQKWYTCFTIPGSEIPNWFRHQNVGASVNLQVPSHLLLSGTLMGIAVCAVEANGDRSSYVWLPLSEEFGKIESYHLWLDCFPFETHFGSYRIEELDANEFTQIELTFEAYGPDLEVTKCGARLIFEQDIEDLKQTKPGSSSSIITPYHEDDDLGGDPKKDSKIKESGDDEAPHPKWTEHPNLIENWIGNSCIQGQADSDCV
ncbi:TMV resistance protein N-like isoform X1 [Quercus lobata]|uniref:ADP-ribosyl cyclase/cyclic ADP-ribose hydrolase n=1 Tax=Quercus lobata TaxID=97700 RepID=A0A7N2MKJ9_QUELO|nr:TMV resistance protein N-like isoform X1 [Quercus lobata]XP_030934369.1 TMV resistance protein N-like isoform X1 [Quercus lobata]XP_030934370.1 TMV resistance protein N-like isoform X1 [Quercus lobata]XP_030934371.1 TMV resistance protein N-like isoform X1 [Quercus lobata]